MAYLADSYHASSATYIYIRILGLARVSETYGNYPSRASLHWYIFLPYGAPQLCRCSPSDVLGYPVVILATILRYS